MTQKSPQHGSGSTPQSRTPGRARQRGSGTRNRSRTMNTLVSVLTAVDKLGVRGRSFGTSDVRDVAGISSSQAYTWLQVLRAHDFVTAQFILSDRPTGVWKWKRCFRIVKIK